MSRNKGLLQAFEQALTNALLLAAGFFIEISHTFIMTIPNKGHNAHSERVVPYVVLIFAIFAYLMPGILGRDPWKQDETYTFGIIYNMLITGDLGIPLNAGQPFMEKPPLFAWVAAGCAFLFRAWLPLHDGARLASVFFGIVTLVFTARAACLCGAAHSWRAIRVVGTVGLFASSIGVLKNSHDLFTDVGLMCGAAIGLYGLLRIAYAMEVSPQDARFWPGVVYFAVGTDVCLMTKGVFIPLVFGITAFLLPIALRSCQSRRYVSALALAFAIAAPFALLWPLWLALHDWSLFIVWFWDNNIGRFLGFSVDQLGARNDKPFYFLYMVWGVAFPAAPLAAVGLLLGGWKQWREPRIALPLIYMGIGLGVLCLSASARPLYLLPFVFPLALLAVEGVHRIPLIWHIRWDWVNRCVFSLAALLVWVIWWVMQQPIQHHARLTWLERWLPLDYVLPVYLPAFASAVLLTLAWLLLQTRFSAQHAWRGVLSWCAGTILVWGLVYTILLPWLNHAKSYGPVFTALAQQLKPVWQPGDCMASRYLGESEAPMLQYFAGILHKPVADAIQPSCRWLIVQGKTNYPDTLKGTWQLFWHGARQGDTVEQLRVFKKSALPTDK